MIRVLREGSEVLALAGGGERTANRGCRWSGCCCPAVPRQQPEGGSGLVWTPTMGKAWPAKKGGGLACAVARAGAEAREGDPAMGRTRGCACARAGRRCCLRPELLPWGRCPARGGAWLRAAIILMVKCVAMAHRGVMMALRRKRSEEERPDEGDGWISGRGCCRLGAMHAGEGARLDVVTDGAATELEDGDVVGCGNAKKGEGLEMSDGGCVWGLGRL